MWDIVRAQVTPSEATGRYRVALSGDEFSTHYNFIGKPDEIRTLLADIEQQLAERERVEAELTP